MTYMDITTGPRAIKEAKLFRQQAYVDGSWIDADSSATIAVEGEVIAVGPGSRDESGKLLPIDLKAGDRALFGKIELVEQRNRYLGHLPVQLCATLRAPFLLP